MDCFLRTLHRDQILQSQVNQPHTWGEEIFPQCRLQKSWSNHQWIECLHLLQGPCHPHLHQNLIQLHLPRKNLRTLFWIRQNRKAFLVIFSNLLYCKTKIGQPWGMFNTKYDNLYGWLSWFLIQHFCWAQCCWLFQILWSSWWNMGRKMMILMKLLKNHPKATQMVSRLIQNHFGLYEQQVASWTGRLLAGSARALGRVFIRVQEEKNVHASVLDGINLLTEKSEVALDLWHLAEVLGEIWVVVWSLFRVTLVIVHW